MVIVMLPNGAIGLFIDTVTLSKKYVLETIMVCPRAKSLFNFSNAHHFWKTTCKFCLKKDSNKEIQSLWGIWVMQWLSFSWKIRVNSPFNSQSHICPKARHKNSLSRNERVLWKFIPPYPTPPYPGHPISLYNIFIQYGRRISRNA